MCQSTTHWNTQQVSANNINKRVACQSCQRKSRGEMGCWILIRSIISCAYDFFRKWSPQETPNSVKIKSNEERRSTPDKVSQRINVKIRRWTVYKIYMKLGRESTESTRITMQNLLTTNVAKLKLQELPSCKTSECLSHEPSDTACAPGELQAALTSLTLHPRETKVNVKKNSGWSCWLPTQKCPYI